MAKVLAQEKLTFAKAGNKERFWNGREVESII